MWPLDLYMGRVPTGLFWEMHRVSRPIFDYVLYLYAESVQSYARGVDERVFDLPDGGRVVIRERVFQQVWREKNSGRAG